MNEEKNDWYKEIKIPEGTNFRMYKDFPIFEIRLNKDMKPNGDFYLYLINNDGSYYGVLKIDKNKNIKETYRNATQEEIKKYNINLMYLKNGGIFVSLNNKLEITHIYWWINKSILLRKDISNENIRQCNFYYDNFDYLNFSKEKIEILKEYDPKYFYTFNELGSGIINPYCVGFIDKFDLNKCTCSKSYDYIKDNLLNLENIFQS